jgi:hypothetical protein
MGQEADVRRGDERNLIGRAKLDDLDSTAMIAIAEDLSLGQEVTDGAVVMRDEEWGEVAVRTDPHFGEGSRNVIKPRKRMQGRTEDTHSTIEGDDRGQQDLPSKSSHPGK